MTDFFVQCGVTGITVLGQMGEAPKLEHQEALALASRVIRRAPVPVIVGVSSAGFAALRTLSRAVIDAAKELGLHELPFLGDHVPGAIMEVSVPESIDVLRLAVGIDLEELGHRAEHGVVYSVPGKRRLVQLRRTNGRAHAPLRGVFFAVDPHGVEILIAQHGRAQRKLTRVVRATDEQGSGR